MKKLIFLMLAWLLLMGCNVFAYSTYYVRTDGGTSAQCTGLANVSYASTGGTGLSQACAFIHPAWAMGAKGTTRVMHGGDTLIMDANSYMIGYGMPNTSGCSASGPFDCYLNDPISGPDSTHPTKIYGTNYASGCATKSTLWGTQNVERVFNMSNVNNIEIQCIEITDHSSCGYDIGGSQCSKSYPNSNTSGKFGIRGAYVTNLTMKNVDVHGMGSTGMILGDLSGVTTFDHVSIDGNHYDGWQGDERFIGGSGAIGTGTFNMNALKVRFNGCSEVYPRSGSFTAADYSDCTDQNYAGSGDGIASYENAGGTWNITNSDISYNVQDGFDLLYCGNCQAINVDKSVFQGNDGNQFKASTKNLNITNSHLIGSCTYLTANNKAYNTGAFFTNQGYGFSSCRAGGVPISLTPLKGSVYKITNTTLTTATDADSSAVFEITNRYGTCDGTETYTMKNDIFYLMPTSTTNWTPYYNAGLSGACSTALSAATTDHSIVYNFSSLPSGTGNSSSSPAFTGTVSGSTFNNLTNLTIGSGSPAKGTATSGLSFWNTSTDYNNFPQNGSTDMGAFQYGTVDTRLKQSGQSCIATIDCASGTCDNFVCSGSCTANAAGCSTNAQCCSGYCSTTCQNPPTCGDGVINNNEVCDTLGPITTGSNCVVQGYQSGTLGCSAGCASYDTSGCSSSTSFPLTPILDNFNRTNEGPPPSTKWTNNYGGTDGQKVVSNALAYSSGNYGEDAVNWNQGGSFTDVEVYITLSTLPSNGNGFALFARTDNLFNNSYSLFWTYNSGGTDTVTLRKHVSGSGSTLGTDNFELTTGDKLGLSIVGTSLKVWKYTSGAWSLVRTVVDSSLSTGVIGVYQTDTGERLDDFGGGALNPVTCGNNLKEGLEVCDGTDLASQSCTTKGFASGSLTCLTDCSNFDTSSCVTASSCGNNTKEVGEICDGTDLASQTCVGLGNASGTLTCASNCLSYVTTGCVSGPTSGIRGCRIK